MERALKGLAYEGRELGSGPMLAARTRLPDMTDRLVDAGINPLNVDGVVFGIALGLAMAEERQRDAALLREEA